MVHLTADELVAYTNDERKKWNRWFVDKPEAMSLPAQRQGRFPTVGSLIDHIFLVERRHLQRLTGQTPIADQTGVADADVAGLFAFGNAVREDLVTYTRSLSEDDARTILIHEIRHWAQVALALRNAGHEPPGNHDLFNSNALT